MRCIFCKQASDNSGSREHIIPESLGNSTLILPPGIVCDRCNNYFARKVEAPFLAHPTVKALRFFQSVPNKRGKLPPIWGLALPDIPVEVMRDVRSGAMALNVQANDLPRFFSRPISKLVVPLSHGPPPSLVVSRFMAKVALEMMASRLAEYSEGLAYLVDEHQLDPLRDHARRSKVEGWPVHTRQIYHPDSYLEEADGRRVQLVHASDFLVTDHGEWFFVLAIFGKEFVINLGGPEIDGYVQWLKANDQRSPLYVAKNSSFQLASGTH